MRLWSIGSSVCRRLPGSRTFSQPVRKDHICCGLTYRCSVLWSTGICVTLFGFLRDTRPTSTDFHLTLLPADILRSFSLLRAESGAGAGPECAVWWFVGCRFWTGWSNVKQRLKQALLSPGQRWHWACPGRVLLFLHSRIQEQQSSLGYGKSWGRRMIVRFLLRAYNREEKHQRWPGGPPGA